MLLVLLSSVLAEPSQLAVKPMTMSASDRLLQYLHSIGEQRHLTQPKPVKATYIDWKDVNWNKPEQNLIDICNGGYNVAILAFFLSSGNAADMAQAWQGVDAATKNSTMTYLHGRGCIAIVSVGGATDTPFTVDPSKLATTAVAWAKANALDGVDFDLENLDEGFQYNGMSSAQVIDWMVQLTRTARTLLGPNGIVTHAPQSPYFGAIGGGPKSNPWTGQSGGYSAVYQQLGDGVISWFNAQFYNQGATCYVTFVSLFNESNAAGACPSFPFTSVREIAAYGVPLGSIVVGKPLESSDAGNGWVSAASLHDFVSAAGSQIGWATGVMNWAWNTADGPSWIHTVYAEMKK